MCGFVGVVGAAPSQKLMIAACDSIIHRGPDGRGLQSGRDWFLGHQRLAILDPSEAGAQPMAKNGNWIAYNGEIYNHQELRKTFVGAEFRGHSDTETLLCGLKEKGASFLRACRGMFAGAFIDDERGEALLFRDPMGIKTLCYAVGPDGGIYFASEIKALFAACPGLVRKVNQATLQSYLIFENFPQQLSLFEGVQPILPGQILRLKRTTFGKWSLREEEILQVSQSESSATFDDNPDRLLAEINASVRRHLLSDVPLASYLSGGIDSSLVTTLAARERPELLAFTGFFSTKDSFYDERAYAQLVAKTEGLESREIEISTEDFREAFDPLIYHLDEPRMGMGSFSQYIMAREVAKERKVILAGHGGDELFAGYPLFKAFWAMEEGISPTSIRELSKMRGPEVPMVADALISRIFSGKLKFAPKIFSSILKEPVGESQWLSAFEQSSEKNPLRLLNNYYLNVYLPGLLVVEDRISMAHGLETRVPFLDLELANYALQCPIDKKIRNGQLKAWLKLAARKVLPSELMDAPKRGFPTPLRLWFREELKEFCLERLVGGGDGLDSLISRKRREKLLKWHCETPLPFAFDERRAHQIWMLLSLESWTRQFKLQL